jgi:hypothetical protein
MYRKHITIPVHYRITPDGGSIFNNQHLEISEGLGREAGQQFVHFLRTIEHGDDYGIFWCVQSFNVIQYLRICSQTSSGRVRL